MQTTTYATTPALAQGITFDACERFHVTPAGAAPVELEQELTFTATEAQRKATVKLIENEYANRHGFYLHALIRMGVPRHELDDAHAELFALALRWAHMYDPSKGAINTWMGNAIARTVASSIYGKRRPGWRRQREQEATVYDGVNNESAADEHDCGEEATYDPESEMTANRFLEALAMELTDTEMAMLKVSGLGIANARLDADQVEKMGRLAGAETRTGARTAIKNLRDKIRRLAEDHFELATLADRPGWSAA